jgi:hypothetical protein
MTGIRLRHLVFTGPKVEPAVLEFQDGLNILYGASNTGKSFASEAILFMIGASKALPVNEEIAAYNGVWLGLILPGGREVTLYRATRGGTFKFYEGLVRSANVDEGSPLQGQHDAKRTDTVSHLLLDAIGLSGKQIVKDANGKKGSLSIRLLAPYMVVSEEDIISTRSPVLASGAPTERTLERNIFKLLLTGMDDSATVAVQKPGDKKVAKAAKIEFVNKLISDLDSNLADVADAAEINDQLDKLDRNSEGLLDRLREAQSELDDLVGKRRASMDRKRELEQRTRELQLTLQRFARLQAVYASDLQRLQSIEEGGFVLVAMAGMDCPVCGAAPDAQRHNHAAEEIALAYRAAAAEVKKIEIEQRELAQTMASLGAEATGLGKLVGQLGEDIDKFDRAIEAGRPSEVSARQSYEAYSLARGKLQRISDLYLRRAEMVTLREGLESEPTKRDGDTLSVGPDSTAAFDFGEVVKKVLKEWHFPGADKAQFDLATNDITIGGKARASNGKGVRAILHAAFNVALIVHSIDKKLPNPGFLVLDTPLLTYREPMKSKKHGALAPDELALKATSLSGEFYRHLSELAQDLQVIIIENSDPPASARLVAKVDTFTGQDGNERYGLLETKES